ncbi:MAG: hypothetical protein JHC26_02680 [Thermofilum sp.]|jgi:hypothetical protein|uniref:hypothetical protein n=1 Tax=Thermofilum sp. TaxID=1961369 RepID=UPI0025860129|nr:hypothetical protein [Thermofilum sp.]MCI4407971.1 hypothetical protein [Thermofilum sp.]
MKYVALAYIRPKEGTPDREKVEMAEKEAEEKWEKLTSKSDRHPYHELELLMESLKKHGIPFLYLKGIEAENKDEVKSLIYSTLRRAFPTELRVEKGLLTADIEEIILPYVEQIVLDPPEDNDKNGNALLRGLAVLSTLVATVTVGWLWGTRSE